MNKPAEPSPEEVWQAESAAESLRASLPPYSLGILSLLNKNGEPMDFAIYVSHIAISPGAEPAPPPQTISMRVNAPGSLNVHSSSSLASSHVPPALADKSVVAIIAESEKSEVVGSSTYIWVALAERIGWVCERKTTNAITEVYLRPA